MEEAWFRKAARGMGAGLLSVFVLCWAGPLHAQADAAQLSRQLAAMVQEQFGTDAQLDAQIASMYGAQLSPEKTAIARRALRVMFFHEGMAPFLARLIAPVLKSSSMSQKQLLAAVSEGIQGLQAKGFGRLRPEQQALLIRHITEMARKISPVDCKAMFLGQVNTQESSRLEREYIGSLPLPKFELITTLYRDSALAELSGYPDPRPLNAQQAALAKTLYEDVAVQRLAKLPVEMIQRIQRNGAGSDAAEYCLYMSTYIESMLDMDEPYKSWQLARFIQSLQ